MWRFSFVTVSFSVRCFPVDKYSGNFDATNCTASYLTFNNKRLYTLNELSMTLLQFRSLSCDIQRQVVQKSGIYLLCHTNEDSIAKLYQINGFYVVLFFDLRMSAVTRIDCFDDPNRLEPYLRQVDVSEVQMLLG